MRGRAQENPSTCNRKRRMPQVPRGVVLRFPDSLPAFEYGTLQAGGKARNNRFVIRDSSIMSQAGLSRVEFPRRVHTSLFTW